MNHLKDNQLLFSQIAEGNKKAFDVFLKLYYPKLIQFACIFVDSTQQPEDVFADVTDGKRSWYYPKMFTDTLRLVQWREEAFFEVGRDWQRAFIVEATGTRMQTLGTALKYMPILKIMTTKLPYWKERCEYRKLIRFKLLFCRLGRNYLHPRTIQVLASSPSMMKIP